MKPSKRNPRRNFLRNPNRNSWRNPGRISWGNPSKHFWRNPNSWRNPRKISWWNPRINSWRNPRWIAKEISRKMRFCEIPRRSSWRYYWKNSQRIPWRNSWRNPRKNYWWNTRRITCNNHRKSSCIPGGFAELNPGHPEEQPTQQLIPTPADAEHTSAVLPDDFQRNSLPNHHLTHPWKMWPPNLELP